MLLRFGASGALPVFAGDSWWTIFSPGWLHGGLLHIFFNMLWVRQLAPESATCTAPGRMMIIYTVSGAVAFRFSSAMGWYFPGVPLSAARCSPRGPRRRSSACSARSCATAAAPGARWCTPRRFGMPSSSSSSGSSPGAWTIMRTPEASPAAGWPRCGSIPMTKERVDHLMLGIACIVITFGAVAASIVAGIPDSLLTTFSSEPQAGPIHARTRRPSCIGVMLQAWPTILSNCGRSTMWSSGWGMPSRPRFSIARRSVFPKSRIAGLETGAHR